MFGRDRTRRFEGVTHVVVQEPLTTRHERLLNRHSAVQIEQMDPPTAGLDWLIPWAPTIDRLLVTDLSVTDVSALTQFTRLTHLTLYCGILKGHDNRVAISALSTLREFAANWYEVLNDVFASPSIERLYLDNPPADVFRRCAQMPALTSLDIRGARKVREIPHLDQPSNLKYLKIALAKVDDIDGLADHPSLESLELEAVKGARNLAALGDMANLRRLLLEDCGEIETLSVLNSAGLEELFLIGTTNILDGDLRSVGRNLRRVTFPQRPHYNATPADLT